MLKNKYFSRYILLWSLYRLICTTYFFFRGNEFLRKKKIIVASAIISLISIQYASSQVVRPTCYDPALPVKDTHSVVKHVKSDTSKKQFATPKDTLKSGKTPLPPQKTCYMRHVDVDSKNNNAEPYTKPSDKKVKK